jgi:hypothetical protein
VPLIRLPRNLHKVSKVVLRRFLACGEISVYDRQGNVIYSKGPSRVFPMEFDSHDPLGAEQGWSDVETKTPFVSQLLDKREAFGDRLTA